MTSRAKHTHTHTLWRTRAHTFTLSLLFSCARAHSLPLSFFFFLFWEAVLGITQSISPSIPSRLLLWLRFEQEAKQNKPKTPVTNWTVYSQHSWTFVERQRARRLSVFITCPTFHSRSPSWRHGETPHILLHPAKERLIARRGEADWHSSVCSGCSGTLLRKDNRDHRSVRARTLYTPELELLLPCAVLYQCVRFVLIGIIRLLGEYPLACARKAGMLRNIPRNLHRDRERLHCIARAFGQGSFY